MITSAIRKAYTLHQILQTKYKVCMTMIWFRKSLILKHFLGRIDMIKK